MGVKPGSIVVVLGGCGFLGRALLCELLGRGFLLRVVTSRPDRHRDLSVLPGLELWEGDVHSEPFLRKVVAGAHALVNLVGTFKEKRPQDFQRAHEELPARIGRVAVGLRILHVSALGARASAGSAYFQSKARGEERLRVGAPAALIVRPAVIYGPYDHFVSRFLRLFRWSPLGLPVPLADSILAPVHVADVVQGLTQALVRAGSEGQLYEFCGPATLSLGEIAGLVAEASGQRHHPWPLSPRASLLLARLGDYVPFAPFTFDEWRTLKDGVPCAHDVPGLSSFGVHPRPFGDSLGPLVSSFQSLR